MKVTLKTLRENIIADGIGRNKAGNFVFRRGFFYRMGGDADKFAASITKQLDELGLEYTVIDSGENTPPFAEVLVLPTPHIGGWKSSSNQ